MKGWKLNMGSFTFDRDALEPRFWSDGADYWATRIEVKKDLTDASPEAPESKVDDKPKDMFKPETKPKADDNATADVKTAPTVLGLQKPKSSLGR